jgi:hypothetical protein
LVKRLLHDVTKMTSLTRIHHNFVHKTIVSGRLVRDVVPRAEATHGLELTHRCDLDCSADLALESLSSFWRTCLKGDILGTSQIAWELTVIWEHLEQLES